MEQTEQKRIVEKRLLNQVDYNLISALQAQCEEADDIALKLELDYKLADAENSKDQADTGDRNEFLYYSGERLIGYVGICGFGGASEPLELTGMVHPDYRRCRIFSELFALAMQECRRRKAATVLGLCDRKSIPGQAILQKIDAARHHSELEMVLQNDVNFSDHAKMRDITLRKAMNEDANEIARQDRIYFADEFGNDIEDEVKDRVRLLEEEEKRGFTIYLAYKGETIVGKVNLQLIGGVGSIYGLGVVPEHRGKGYGRAILLHAIRNLKGAKADEILLQVAADNDKALRLYLSCGFETKSVMDYFTLM